VRLRRDYREVSSAVFDETTSDKKTTKKAFHSLWSKAVGTKRYDKDEWLVFASMPKAAGISV
jgi:hypothetical protein